MESGSAAGMCGAGQSSYIQPDGDRLFAVEETENGAAMAIFETEKGLALQARYETPGSGMCHVTRCGACLYGSSYAGRNHDTLGKRALAA